ncbi:MAG: hypothetical protein IIX16_08630 [Clostridia bacterium]|nr:hypothetical protein [Clostridia bacterium]
MKKVLSVFLAVVMILSICTVGVSASDYVWIYTSRQGAQIDNYLYFPVYYDNGGYYACYGDEDAKVKITIPFFYDPEVLKPVEVTPSELLYGMNFESEISRIDVYKEINKSGYEVTYPYFYADITFDGDTKINKGEVLFNVKMEIIGDLDANNGIDLFDHYYIVEDLEQEKLTCCKWEVFDGDGNVVYDISSKIWQNVPMDGIMDEGYILEGYEPFIPPVEDDNVENGIYDRITISSDVYHARKGDYAYFPVYYDCKTAYSEIADNDSGSSTKIILAFLYNDHLIEPVEAIPSEQLYNIGGTTEIIRVDKYVDEDAVAIPYIYVEVNFDGCIDINNDVLFNVKFEVISDNFFDEYGRLDMGGLFDEFWLVDDDNVLTFHFSEWKINKSNGNVKNISPYVTTNSVSQFTGGTYDDLLLKNYEPFIPPVEEGKLTADTKFENEETYYINNYEDLKTLSYLINEKGESTQGVTFVQTKNIVANSGTFSLDENNAPLYNGSTSLPEAFESIKNFSGIFDGQNYTISGLYLNAGLFENCEGAEIKNIYIENSLVLNEDEASSGLGTISSVFKNSTMAGCSVDAIVIGKGNDVGGVVGKMVEKSSARDSRNLGNVFGGRNVGGVAGTMDASYAYDCYNAGDVCGKTYVGGFAGYMDNSGAGSSYNIGDVSGGPVGGFAGCLAQSSPSSCYTAGKVNGASTGAFCGEFIGDFFDMFDISGCYFLGYSQSGFDASGTVGYLYSLYRQFGNSIMYPPGSYYPAVVYTLSVSPMTEAELKSKDISISSAFVYDAANENEGYPMMKYFHKEHTFSDYFANQDGTVLVAPCSSRKCEETHTIAHTHTWGEYTTDANGNQAAKCLDEMCKFTNVKDKTISRVTVDPIDFTTNEGKIYNFTFEKDGDYKLTISAPEKAALCASVYLNGELVEENTILKWTEGLNLSSYYTEGTVQTAEIELKGISAGDKIVVILHDKTGVDDTISRVSYYLKYYYEKFAPSSVKLTIGKLLPPPEEITVNVGTTDVITFEEDETKLFKFSAEKDGDYKFTVSGADKALVRVKAYKNGELLSEEIVATSSELSSAYDSVMMPASSLELKGLAAGDEIVLEVTESVNWAIDTEPDFKGFEEYFMPSGVTVCVEDITPPPPEEITVNVGTTDVITFEEDETKLFKFSAEKDGDYKFTVSGADKALVRIKAYKNGELISEDIVMTTDELSSAHEIYMKSFAEFELKGLAAGDEIVFEVTESVNYAVETKPHLKGLEQYFMPSGVTVCVEDITPLFNFGVTPQHIRKSNDMVYYPATFDFSMYEDSDIRYSDICRDNANGANGWPTTFTAKYIYDASTLDFIEIYANSSFAEVKVLEHGSTGETGPDGQEYNYIIVQTTFSSIGFGDGKGMYYLKFAVIEENFINADGSIRTVVDNVPYNGNPFAWEVTDPNGDIHDWSKRVEFNSFDGGKESYIYNDLLLEDDLIETNVYINTTITPEHGRIDNYAYYPVEYKPSGGRTYESWVRTLTGYSDGSTKAKYWVYYDSNTLELVDALPSKELYDLGGTVTVLEKGVLDPVNYPGIRYAVVQVEFEGFSDLEPGYLMSFKFNVLKEDFIEANSSAKNLVQISLEDWSVTNTTGKSIDVTDYVFTDVFELAGLKTYSDLIIDGYVPFDPELFGTDEEVFELVGGATVMAQGGVNYIVGLQPSLTKAKFKSTYVNYGNVDVEISATTSRYLGTGSTVTVKSKSTGEVVAEYVVVIYGDVDGSATINGRDALAVSNSVSGAADVLTGAAKLAANVEGTRTTINAKDAAVISSVAGGTMIIDQTTGKGIAA